MYEIDDSKLPKGINIDEKELQNWHNIVNSTMSTPYAPPTEAYGVSSNLRTPFVLAQTPDVQRQFYRNGSRLFRFMPNQGSS